MARRVLRFLQIGGRFCIPLIFAAIVGVNAYNLYRPWSVADDLVPKRPGQVRLLVGAGYSSRSTYAAAGQSSERTAHYVYYPEVFRTKQMHMLSRTNDERPTIHIDTFSPLTYVVELLVLAAISVAAWWRPLVKGD
jgi:hypothetical protein